jgi:arylsulfatase A-like enzyme
VVAGRSSIGAAARCHSGAAAALRLVALVVAAPLAALALLLVDLAWIRGVFPGSSPREEITALAAALAPTAVALGLAVALLEMLGGIAVVCANRWLVRRGLLRPPGRLAAVAAAASTPIAVLLAMALLPGVRDRALVRPAILAGCIASTAALVWLAVHLALRLRLAVRAAEPRWAGGVRAGGAIAAAAAALGLVAVDHSVLVRLHEPLHLCLRLGALGGLQAALLFLWPSVLARCSVERANRLPAAVTVAAFGILALAVGAPPVVAAAIERPALSMALIYGGSAATIAEVHGRLPRRPSRPAPLAHIEPIESDTQPSPGAESVSPGHGAGLSTLPGASLLLVTVDALRADHLGTYGYGRPTSPVLDRLGRDGVVFERAYAAAPHTSFALTSLLTGRPAVALAHLGRLDGHPTLADLLHARGYATAAFIPPAVFFVEPERFSSYRRRQLGFRHLDMQALGEDRSAPLQTAQVLAYLDRLQPSRFAAWVHYFAPHEPYVDHPDDGPPFGTTALDRYDGEIRWVDREIGRLVEGVRARHPRTVVVVTADHGEEFGEHGGAYHGTTLFDEQIRVPLIVNGPGIAPRRIAEPAGAVDVLPTLLGLLDVPAALDFPGSDLRPRLAGVRAPEGGTLAAAVAENGAALRMIVGDGHKLICNVRWPDCMLFDLTNDPRERSEISAARAGMTAKLKHALDTWVSFVAAAGEGSAPNPEGKRFLGEVLARARLRDRAAAQDLLALLVPRELAARERREVARHLALLASSGDRSHLRQLALAEPDLATATWLRITLTGLGDLESAALLELELRRNAAADVDAEILVHGALALANASPSPPADLLSRALGRTDDVETRCDLFRALGQSRDRAEAARLLMDAYETVRTRICAARALAALAHPESARFVLDKLPVEAYADVQLQLIEALRRMRDIRAVPVLTALKSMTPEPEVRAAVERALTQLRQEPGPRPSVRLWRGGPPWSNEAG